MAKHTTSKDGVVEPNVGTEELEKALEKSKADDDRSVYLVAVTMKDHNKIQVPVARGFKFVDVPALGMSPMVSHDWAQRVVAPKRLNSTGVKPAIVWHIAPEPRPRNHKMKYFERDGRRFGTCTFAPPKGTIVNGREIHHSISQSLHFISKVLRTVPGIQRWITEFDTRPEVAAWGNFVIQQREQEERDALGVSASAAVTV